MNQRATGAHTAPGSQSPQFGVPAVQRIALVQRWKASRALFGPDHASTLKDVARLCIGYGVNRQPFASPGRLWLAVNVFAVEERVSASHDANREGALTIAALAAELRHAGRLRDASVFANNAFFMLYCEKTAHDVDVVRTAHLGAICWAELGSHENASKALASAEDRLVEMSRNDFPAVFVEHERLRNRVINRKSICQSR